MTRGQARKEPDTITQVQDMVDVHGVVQKIPVQMVDPKQPQKDSDGSIPEFVNISGKQVLITVKGFPMNTIKVTKWGILKGSQWRDRSQPAPAWGRYPPFIERKKSSSGEYDPVYMLTEDQAIEEIKKHINPEPGFGSRSRLKGFEKFAKVPVFNEVGIEYDDGTRGEDRARVLAAINVQKTMLEEQWAKAQKSMML